MPVKRPAWPTISCRQGRSQRPRAIIAAAKTITTTRTNAWALNNRGLACRNIGKKEKARRDFAAALRIEPGFDQATRNLAGVNSPR